MVGLVAYPFGYALVLSLTAKQAGVPARFVGLRNSTDLFRGDIFLHTVRNSLVFIGAAIASRPSSVWPCLQQEAGLARPTAEREQGRTPWSQS